MTPAIQVRGLVKRYGDTVAVAGIDLTVGHGEVFAILGPNGAGKTTTVEILEGHRARTSGSVTVLGVDPERGGRSYRDRIGIVLQSTSIESELSVTEAIDIYGGLYSRRRPTKELVELVGLGNKAEAKVKTLSGGQQRRLELALGLVGDPDLLFLDEPTTGFDPSARRQAWLAIEELASLGKTILLTTHYMEEAQRLADRIAIIDAGRLVAEGTPQSLVSGHQSQSVIRFSLPGGVSASRLPVAPNGDDHGVVEYRTDDPTGLLATLTGWAVAAGIKLLDISVDRSSLEEVYLDLTGEEG